ncbi:hypothetical protein CABS03_11959 [Colletotrichum abscissum]|uniref:Uncharacterized protein n=1 Tax=Colletotrichum abscissum TaxID=1671311 RepID=A0A9Q0B8F6_9PEZI|nr:hypothetical protein CABS02_02478 [Colletotrichum abscissum]
MCNYTQREFHCGHVRWIVSRWCPVYTRTQRRCPPCVTHFEYRGDEVCGMSSLHGNAVLYPSFALGESIIAHSSTPGRAFFSLLPLLPCTSVLDFGANMCLIVGECKPSAPIVWESMIRRNNTPVGL